MLFYHSNDNDGWLPPRVFDDIYNDTPLSLERPRLLAGEPWAVFDVAGLQYYAYGRYDELIGTIIPSTGDALNLMRRPDNRADDRAIEVWWRNQHHMGHVPRDVAFVMSPPMDLGRSARAYCLNPGDGEAWSMRAIVIGRAVEELHTRQLRRYIDRESERFANEEFRGAPRRQTGAQKAAGQAFKDTMEGRGADRMRQALDVFGPDLMRRRGISDELKGPIDEAMRGRSFRKWDDVPAWLATSKTWKDRGFKVRKDSSAFARKTGGYETYSLYSFHDVDPTKPRSDKALASDAFEAFMRGRDGEALFV